MTTTRYAAACLLILAGVLAFYVAALSRGRAPLLSGLGAVLVGTGCTVAAGSAPA